MKKIKLMAISLLMLSSCRGVEEMPRKGSVNNDVTIFAGTESGIIGDPMPYFDGEYMNYFYLLEESDKSIVGFHPWALIRTKDFITYEDKGVAIPYEKDAGHQDLALGTGSIIQDKNGLYHAYYTGYNSSGNTDYFEKIQHATSNDLLNWTKHPEHGFFGGHNDFRDPYVFYNDETNNYWMLITTRENNHGVIKLYTSHNLVNWTYDRVLFYNDAGSYNMECPSLLKIGAYWYLVYSEQGSFRVTHYRYTSDLNSGVWVKPTIDYFDGVGVYAGRIEKYHERTIFTGWQAVKYYDYDGGDYDWGGNLVNHELIQLANGELRAQPLKEVIDALNNEVEYRVSTKTDALLQEEKNFIFSKGEYEHVIFEQLEKKSTKITFTLSNLTSGIFGLSFAHDNENAEGELNVAFNLNAQKLEFYNVKTTNITQSIAQAYVPFEPWPAEVNVTVLSEDECLSVYVENQQVLSSRLYTKTNLHFGLFALNTSVTFKEVSFYE